MDVERLQVGWRSPIYGFFKANVSVGYDEGRKFHFFKCAAQYCKGKGHKGVRRYLDSKDRAATSNLKTHASGKRGLDLEKPGETQVALGNFTSLRVFLDRKSVV